ncbi:MAG: lysine 2,3-aminomutase [Candidatus Eremiobacteraeota bacterium]|nr:lysine 2,3-aminomutase [Candidatus Eremiobacteraeota bacterium]
MTKSRIKFDKTSEQWNDWKWQLRNCIRNVEQLKDVLQIGNADIDKIRSATDVFPMSITPYYASLMGFADENCPIRKQAIPDPRELQMSDYDIADPLHEDGNSPVPGLTHRYPDRVLLLVTSECSMYCRHCTRKRKVGDKGESFNLNRINRGIEYIRQNKNIRDVLISGGDPLLLETEVLEKIIRNIRSIPHVEVVRIGTRVPVVLPFRIDYKLVEMLKKYHPIWINTHFNHPKELTPESKKALRILADAGIPLGNQSVLLRGINDCPNVMKKLLHELVRNRVRPYYIYQCDLSRGIEHFRTPISRGMEIMEGLIGHTSGIAVPRFVVDAPGGGGKIPIQPNYLVSFGAGKTVLRNYEGIITVYNEPKDYFENAKVCPKNCNLCGKDNKPGEETRLPSLGVEKLLDETVDDISLVPEGNIRSIKYGDQKKMDSDSDSHSSSEEGEKDNFLLEALSTDSDDCLCWKDHVIIIL